MNNPWENNIQSHILDSNITKSLFEITTDYQINDYLEACIATYEALTPPINKDEEEFATLLKQKTQYTKKYLSAEEKKAMMPPEKYEANLYTKLLNLTLKGNLSLTYLEYVKYQVLNYSKSAIGDLSYTSQFYQPILKRFKVDTLHNLFKLVHYFDFNEKFEQDLESSSAVKKIVTAYKIWKKNNTDYIANLEKYDPDKKEEIEPQLEITPPQTNEPKVIELDYPLVIGGEPDEGLAHIKGSIEEDNKKVSHRRHKKTDLLLTVLEKAGIPMSSVTIYKEKSSVEGPQTGRYPYQVIDIHDDKLSAQVVLCNYTGFSTYIDRTAEPFDPLEPTVISDLRDIDTVWKTVFKDENQWNREIHQNLFTPVKSLPIQLKHILYWGDQKHNLIATFKADLAATGKLWKTNDTRIIKVGPLKGKTTPARALTALSNGSVLGIDAKNVFELFDIVNEADPRIAKHKERNPIPSASEIFNRSAKFIRETQLAPQTAFYNDITQYGRPAQLISEAFEFDAVQGWQALVEDPKDSPNSLEQFIVATRLGTWNEDGTVEATNDLDSVIDLVKERERRYNQNKSKEMQRTA